MLKKKTALMLAVCMLLAGLVAAPAALASDYYSARTTLSGSGSNKLNNIDLAIEAINGTVVPYGGSFSFNETVGPRTKDRGYKTAPNGRGVKVTGGGVAQAASTLYLALLQVRGDIEIDPVKTYGSRFTDNYVSSSDQAIITDYDADIDLSFTNYEDEMTIDMWANDSYVYCSITVGSEDANTVWDAGSSGRSGAKDLITAEAVEKEPEGSDGWFISSIASGDEGERTLLASASLDCGDDDDVIHNADLAADCITDTTLNRGDLFSFNDIVGPRTKNYGYVRAKNGRGAKVTGGGVAQVASVIWLTIKDLDDISIVEKATYGKRYNQDYVSRSSDAILTDYSAGRDFSFRYTGDDSITIYTYVGDGRLYCDIYENSEGADAEDGDDLTWDSGSSDDNDDMTWDSGSSDDDDELTWDSESSG